MLPSALHEGICLPDSTMSLNGLMDSEQRLCSHSPTDMIELGPKQRGGGSAPLNHWEAETYLRWSWPGVFINEVSETTLGRKK